ncbi:hypothetical protein [Mycoplasma phocimorsus]|uniref:hypothetical protein n=1 Tax=Mycoplasma phocimorsus TaxID=3045839 RepID=UPI0024C09F77|nr:hypothetical protein [Mycoplasma phocimorsus]MDJ1647304.1 hypothetical protein [Mycoplasma phocimorsus]MDJ1647601.1 hypothetical protein [Mycoplasma phocimorsus]MDJ1648055.1 hypothetical protein [Mycoplasma phocimorsus]MDJ1648936.1 hypothetical protein [Mycoplasma phocimorsus]
MSKIKINYNYIDIERALKNFSSKTFEVVKEINNYSVKDFEYFNYKDTIYGYNIKTFEKIFQQVNEIYASDIEYCLVICPKTVSLQIEMIIKFLINKYLDNRKYIQIEFVSPDDVTSKIDFLKHKFYEKKFILVNYIFKDNKSQNYLFEIFKTILIKNIGFYNAKKLIYYGIKTSDLQNLYFAKYEGYKTLIINEKLSEEFSIYSIPSLFILALSGVDSKQLVDAAIEAFDEFDYEDIKLNVFLEYVTILLSLDFDFLTLSSFDPATDIVAEFVKEYLFIISNSIVRTSSFPNTYFANWTSKFNIKCLQHFIWIKEKRFDYEIYDDVNDEDHLSHLDVLNINKMQDTLYNMSKDIQGEYGYRPLIELILTDRSEISISQFIIFIQKVSLLLKYLRSKKHK